MVSTVCSPDFIGNVSDTVVKREKKLFRRFLILEVSKTIPVTNRGIFGVVRC
jgi:hypothetical protein